MDLPCPHPRLRKQGDRFVCAECGESPDGPVLPRWRIDLTGWKHLAGGAVITLVLSWWGGFFLAVIGILKTLVHEIGHAAAGWIVGRGSLPAFDFQNGGGFTTIHERSNLLVGVWGLVWVALLLHLRGGPWFRGALVLLGIQAVLIATPLDQLWIMYAGHAGELVFAGIFLVRAATGMAVVQVGEAWLYAILGWALWLRSLALAWDVWTDPTVRDQYLEGKRGVDNDLVQAADFLGIGLGSACVLHLVIGVVAIAAALAFAGWWSARNAGPAIRR